VNSNTISPEPSHKVGFRETGWDVVERVLRIIGGMFLKGASLATILLGSEKSGLLKVGWPKALKKSRHRDHSEGCIREKNQARRGKGYRERPTRGLRCLGDAKSESFPDERSPRDQSGGHHLGVKRILMTVL